VPGIFIAKYQDTQHGQRSHYESAARRSGGRAVPDGTHSIRALDIPTGKTVWNYLQVGGGHSTGGTLSTGGSLVFFGGTAAYSRRSTARPVSLCGIFSPMKGFAPPP
jgi:hypothetical protein